jgi:hypothetical protein
VNIDGTREVEDAFDRCVNEGEFFESDHGYENKDEHKGHEGARKYIERCCQASLD